LSYLANTQTDRQTNKNRQKHNLLGGGNTCVPSPSIERIDLDTLTYIFMQVHLKVTTGRRVQ